MVILADSGLFSRSNNFCRNSSYSASDCCLTSMEFSFSLYLAFAQIRTLTPFSTLLLALMICCMNLSIVSGVSWQIVKGTHTVMPVLVTFSLTGLTRFLLDCMLFSISSLINFVFSAVSLPPLAMIFCCSGVHGMSP